MRKNRSFLVFSALIFACLSVWAPRLGVARRSLEWSTPRRLNQSAASGNPVADYILRQRTAAPALAARRMAKPRSAGAGAAIDSPHSAGELGRLTSASQVELSSLSVGRRFYEIAYELANREDVRGPAVEQAILFLTAAMELDGGTGDHNNDVRSLLLKLACRDPQWGYSDLVYNLLVECADEFTDLEMSRKAVRYLLGQRNSHEQREELLQEMARTLGDKNVILGSDLATSLGLLMAEKADLAGPPAAAGSSDHTPFRRAAQFYFLQAYNSNRYNRLAFAQLLELMPEQIGPATYLERLRLALRENPSDIEAALAFAQCAEQLQLYEMAEAGYEYCSALFAYLYPSEPLPARIYIPWAVSSYNMSPGKAGTQRSHSKCLQIADRVRQDGRFDLLIEALAAKAAAKIGNDELATEIFRAAEEKARQLSLQRLKRNSAVSGKLKTQSLKLKNEDGNRVEQFAWFYCFALPDAGRALYWANEAYAAEPNSSTAAAILAYSLVMNNQLKWAKPLLKNYQPNQIADLTLAQIQLAEGQRDLAVETLRSAIAKDPGSLAAERAKEILAQQGEKYIPPVDPDVLLTVLRNAFGQALVPVFTPPEQIISVQFSIRGNTFPYGSEFDGTVAIINNSSEPLVISDDGLFMGNIRIDADITGDLNEKIPNLVSARNRPVFLVEPGRSTLISVPLVTGELRKTLLTHPQASLDIEFTLYLDPVTTPDGEVTNRLTYVKPVKVQVKRPGIELTGRYLTNRFNSISTGQLGQKIKIAQLFVGLLTEQHTMSDRELPYRFMYADWVPPLLRSALLHEYGLLRNPAEGQWVVKVHTMAEMLSLPLDRELISAVAENLNNPNWPVRMMAVYLLAQNADSKFDEVLEWMAEYDSSRIVRSMATALGMSVPERYASRSRAEKNKHASAH